jgi:hypothetical protein
MLWRISADWSAMGWRGIMLLNGELWPGIKRIVGLDWYIIFEAKKDPKLYFDTLKQIFNSVATIKKFNYDKLNNGYIATVLYKEFK